MKKLVYIFLLLVFFLSNSCSIQFSEKRKLKSESFKRAFIKSGLNPVFNDVVYSYILKNDMRLEGKSVFIYPLLFFQNNGETYFSIWRSSCFPAYLTTNYPNSEYYICKVEWLKIVIITNNNTDRTLFEFPEKMEKVTLDKIPHSFHGSDIDEGINLMTFKVRKDSSKVFLEPSQFVPVIFSNDSVNSIIEE